MFDGICYECNEIYFRGKSTVVITGRNGDISFQIKEGTLKRYGTDRYQAESPISKFTYEDAINCTNSKIKEEERLKEQKRLEDRISYLEQETERRKTIARLRLDGGILNQNMADFMEEYEVHDTAIAWNACYGWSLYHERGVYYRPL